MKTLLLENDSFLWKGLDEFCKSFDPNYVTIRTDVKKDYMPSDDYSFVAMLCQPFVERCITASAFESQFNCDLYHQKNEEGLTWQLEHFVHLILACVRFREQMKYTSLTFEIEYHGHDFIEDLNEDRWGNNCTRMIDLLIRQNVDNLTVNIYKEYKFVKRLMEADFK